MPPPLEPRTPQKLKRKKNRFLVLGGRTFRFNLNNFRLNGFSIRRLSLAEAAVILMMAFLASRALGVVRQMMFNALFDPASAEVKAYIASIRLPELILNLVAGGALIHAFVPIFLAHEREKGEQGAWQLSSLVFNMLLVIMTLMLIIGYFITPGFVDYVLVPGLPADERALTTDLTRIMLIQILILGLGTVFTAILNSKRQFLLPALSFAVYNLGVIGGLVVSWLVPSVGIYGPTYGTLVAVMLQVGVQIPGLVKQRVRYYFSWDWRHPALRQIGILLIPNAMAVGVASFANIVDTFFASYMKDPNSLAALTNSEMLQALPVALIAQAVSQSLLPHLSTYAATKRYFRMRQMATKVLWVSLALTLPAMVALIVAGAPLIRILFQHGAYTAHASHLTYLALIGFALSIPGQVASNLLAAGFFAFKDALTPFLTNTFSLLERCLLLYFFFQILPNEYIILAVPLGQAIATLTDAVLLYVLLFWRLRRRMKDDRAIERWRRRSQFLISRTRSTQSFASEKG